MGEMGRLSASVRSFLAGTAWAWSVVGAGWGCAETRSVPDDGATHSGVMCERGSSAVIPDTLLYFTALASDGGAWVFYGTTALPEEDGCVFCVQSVSAGGGLDGPAVALDTRLPEDVLLWSPPVAVRTDEALVALWSQCDGCIDNYPLEPSPTGEAPYFVSLPVEADGEEAEPRRIIAASRTGLYPDVEDMHGVAWTGQHTAFVARTVLSEPPSTAHALFLLDGRGVPVDETFVDYTGETSAQPIALSPDPRFLMLAAGEGGTIHALYDLQPEPGGEVEVHLGNLALDGSLHGEALDAGEHVRGLRTGPVGIETKLAVGPAGMLAVGWSLTEADGGEEESRPGMVAVVQSDGSVRRTAVGGVRALVWHGGLVVAARDDQEGAEARILDPESLESLATVSLPGDFVQGALALGDAVILMTGNHTFGPAAHPLTDSITLTLVRCEPIVDGP
jgi:hypothetical protein